MISISADIKRATAALDAAARRQIPYASQLAVNDLAFQAQRAELAGIGDTFKHPRPFTAKSVQVNKATKSDPTATVFIRPEVAKYLEPYEDGGVHVLPGKALLDPVDIKLDQYGQLPKNVMKRLAARPDIFIGRVETKSGPINGVWQRLQVTRKGNTRRGRRGRGGLYHPEHGELKLLIRFGDALPVNKRLDFKGRGEAVVRAGATATFNRALAKALASAR